RLSAGAVQPAPGERSALGHTEKIASGTSAFQADTGAQAACMSRGTVQRTTDPCPLVGQVKEIRELESARYVEQDPCHLVWQVNKIRSYRGTLRMNTKLAQSERI